jgi:hypothetical protein
LAPFLEAKPEKLQKTGFGHYPRPITSTLTETLQDLAVIGFALFNDRCTLFGSDQFKTSAQY